MKKIFTLISMAFVAISVNAQDVYDAIVDGKLAPEFAAVAGDNGGVANNAADGKSIITMKAGKATVTAVGGTTPANVSATGGDQQIVPGAAIEGKDKLYEVAQVNAWNDIEWNIDKSKASLGFSIVKGKGNPYVQMFAEEIYKDDAPTGTYRAAYDMYEPDGSKGLPISGLYYKFSASAKGAFKVKVWINKGGTNFTYVVNSKDAKAQKLFASGYINGVTGSDGQMRMLTVEQVDSVHHDWIWSSYEAAMAKGKADDQTQDEFNAKMAEMKAECEANEVKFKYVVGRNNQPFWGWLTFDVEAGEEYYVFQGQTQIGFAGFEFHEGKTAEELIGGIEAAYAYTTNFSTYENDNGERVTWKGEKAVGNGQFTSTEEEGAPFGDFFQNDGSAVRTSYCLLPEDVLAHSKKTHELTIAFWVSAEGFTPDQYTYAPLFTAYAQKNTVNTNPMFALQSRGLAQVNCNGWCDFTGANNVSGKNNVYNTNAWEAGDAAYNKAGNWLEDQKWHYYTAVFTDTNAKIFLDGEVKNEWNVDGTSDGQVISGLFVNGEELKYVCLGGNQAWDWNDNDAPFRFARLLIKNSKMSAAEIKDQMLVDFPGYEEYQAGGETGVSVIKTVQNSTAVIYNLAGQKVSNSFKGIVVKDGRKMIQK